MISQPTPDQLTIVMPPAKTSRLALMAQSHGVSTVEMAAKLIDAAIAAEEATRANLQQLEPTAV